MSTGFLALFSTSSKFLGAAMACSFLRGGTSCESGYTEKPRSLTPLARISNHPVRLDASLCLGQTFEPSRPCDGPGHERSAHGVDDRVQRGARPHRAGTELRVRVVIAADRDRLALHGGELADDLRLV